MVPTTYTEEDLSPVECATLGFYEPGFIHLNIKTDDNLDKLNDFLNADFKEEWGATFLHEYIHFLQDLTTPHGLLNFIHQIEFLKNANKEILNLNQNAFIVPIEPDNKHNILANGRLLNIYYGVNRTDHAAHSADKITYEKYTSEPQLVELKDDDSIGVKMFFVHYVDENAKSPVKCHFGSRQIKESMAHIIQRQYDLDSTKNHPDNPYRLVNIILENELIDFNITDEFAIALCDASLFSYNPAQLFFSTIDRLKKDNRQSFKSTKEIYDYILSEYKAETLEGETKTLIELYHSNIKIAKKQFNDTSIAAVYEPNRVWFSKILDRAQILRTQKIDFFTSLVETDGTLSKVFEEIWTSLGTPFLTNEEFKGSFLPPSNIPNIVEIKPYFPKVFKSIKVTYMGKKQCHMYKLCVAAKPDITNNLCKTEPWKRTEMEELCPYAQMWKSWGLSDKTPTHRTTQL